MKYLALEEWRYLGDVVQLEDQLKPAEPRGRPVSPNSCSTHRHEQEHCGRDMKERGHGEHDPWLGEHSRSRETKEPCAEEQANEDVSDDRRFERRPNLLRRHPLEPMDEAMEKMGRYMAMTRPPMTTPRNTMMRGSSILVRFSTAWSTSSS